MNTCSRFLYIDSVEEVVRLLEVELQKPRNMSVHESEECEHGVDVGVGVMKDKEMKFEDVKIHLFVETFIYYKR